MVICHSDLLGVGVKWLQGCLLHRYRAITCLAFSLWHEMTSMLFLSYAVNSMEMILWVK